MNSITLTRSQMDKIVEFVTHFKNIEWFTIEERNESGIGPAVFIKCSIFGNDSEPETIVDITDVNVW